MGSILITPGSRVPPGSPEFPEPEFPGSLPTGGGNWNPGKLGTRNPRFDERTPAMSTPHHPTVPPHEPVPEDIPQPEEIEEDEDNG
jgi:hypothetical protein